MLRKYLPFVALAVLSLEVLAIVLALSLPAFQALIRSRALVLTITLISLGSLSLLLLAILARAPKAAGPAAGRSTVKPQDAITPKGPSPVVQDAAAGATSAGATVAGAATDTAATAAATAKRSLKARLEGAVEGAAKIWKGLISIVGEKTVYQAIMWVGFTIGVPPGIMLMVEKQVLKPEARQSVSTELAAKVKTIEDSLASLSGELSGKAKKFGERVEVVSAETKQVDGKADAIERRVIQLEKSPGILGNLKDIKIELVDKRNGMPNGGTTSAKPDVLRDSVEALAKAIAAVHWTSYHDAVVQYDKVIANQVSNAYVMQLKAHAMLRADKPIFAEACARQALKFDEKYLRAHLTLAAAMCAQKKFSDAQKVFRRADMLDEKAWVDMHSADGLAKRYCKGPG